jgi:alkaline phosphatase D
MKRVSDRREFLKQLLATGSVAWLASQTVFGQALTESFANPVSFTEKPNKLDRAFFEVNDGLNPQQVFPLSVASGDPRQHGIVLWTRVDPAAVVNPQTPVAYQIATSNTFSASSLVLEGLATVSAAKDYTVKLPLENTALQPFRTYYYRFIYNQTASRTGRFKTLPTEQAYVSRLRFAFVSCQDYANGYYTALQYLAQENLDFIVHLGDYIYETASTGPVRSIPALPSGAATAQTIDDYRHIWRVYRSDLNLQAVHENFACISIWDDHEFANDSWREFHPDDNITPDTPRPDQRQAANQAWSEYNLADVPFNPALPPTESIKAYRSFRFGRLMELVVTDERLYRDGPPCGFNTVGQRYATVRCAEAESPTRTMLGQTQRDWFINKMTTSTATWKFWANEVMLMQFRILNSIFSLTEEQKAKLPKQTQKKIEEVQQNDFFVDLYLNLDQWDGYPAERAAIFNALRQANVKNLVAITGDIHSFLAGYLKTDFDSNESPLGIELVVGSVTSSNFGELIGGVLGGGQVPSAPIPPEVVSGIVDLLVSGLILLTNPHMQFFNSSTHGYAVLEVTPFGTTSTFKVVSTVQSPTAELRTLKRYFIPRDVPALIPTF